MKLQKKQSSAAIAFALMLTMFASLATSVPTTFGQAQLVSTTASELVLLNPIGLGQVQMLRATVWPVSYSINHTYTITKPDGTKFTLVNASAAVNEESFVTFVCDQLGTWSATASWAGDGTHRAAIGGLYNPNTVPWVVQSANVTDPPVKVPTKCVIGTTPKDKVGTGDAIYIDSWLHPPREYVGALFPEFDYVITKPDGTTDTITGHPDSPATHSFSYVCSQAGTYSVVMKFPEDYLHLASQSAACTWVAEDGYVVPTYPSEPLPTGLWKFPISIEYQQWYQISGPWPESGYNASQCNFNPYSTAPNTPHIIWRDQGERAGITGGSPDMGGGGIVGYSGSFPSCVAAQGRIYYTKSEPWPSSATTLGSSHPVLYCLDQYTGQLIYKKDITGVGSGTPYLEIQPRIKADPESAEFAAGGAFSLWLIGSGVWEVNPWEGQVSYYNATLMGSASMYYNSTIIIMNYPMTGNMTCWSTRSKSILWTVNGAFGTYGTSGGWIGSFPYLIWNGILVGVQGGIGGYPFDVVVRTWNITDGSLMATSADLGVYASLGAPPCGLCAGDGKVYIHCQDMYTYAVDLYTGRVDWKSDTPTSYAWGEFVAYNAASAYGVVIEQGWDGYLYAYDTATGKLAWKSFYTGNTTETAMGDYAWWGKLAIADNKIYGATAQHTQPSPNARGDKLYCLNASDGTLIWSLGPWQGGSGGVSSGMFYQTNGYDGCLYMFGKGQTATTVSVSPSVTHMETVMIQGTVTDQSPGAPGTPAVSDASQTQWMEYLYMNKPMPINATGVTVHLQAMKSDGTVIDITHVTTDIMGHYEYIWCPPDQDTYKILATFEGSNSYWTSSGQCALGAIAVLPTASPPAAAPDNTPIFAGIIAAVVIAILIGILNLIMLRRRK